MHQTGTAATGEILPFKRRQCRRVMFFGKNMSRTRATGGLVEALRGEGLEVKWLNKATLRRWLGWERADRYMRRAFDRFEPDLVFVFCRDLPFPLLQEFGQRTTTVIWVEEPLDSLNDDYVEYLAEAHAVFMTNPTKVVWLRERGLEHVSFMLEGFSASFHHPASTRPARRDLAFIGGPGQRGQRASFLAAIAERYTVDVFGNQWPQWRHRYPDLRVNGPVKPRRYREICASSRIVIGINQINADSLYFSNRTFLTLGCRGFHLTHYVPGLEQVFERGVHLDWYRDLDECMEKIDHYLAHPEERARIAAAGYDLVTSRHQYVHRVRDILQSLRVGRSSLRSELALRAIARPNGMTSVRSGVE